MSHVICEITDGLRPAEATVSVRDYTGRMEYLPVDRGILTRANGKHLLPIRLIYQDEVKNAAFIELPDEADSGTTRLWVRLADIQSPETVS